MSENEVVIVSAVRTPFSKFGGVLKDFRSIDLGALVIRECLQRVDFSPAKVEEVNYGVSVILEAGTETAVPGRQAIF
jgi:acetyl-CoA C-acetyltransferase